MGKIKRILAALAAGAATAALIGTGGSASALPTLAVPKPPRVTLPGLVPPLAHVLTGLRQTTPSKRIELLVQLRPRDAAALDRLIARVSNPRSRSYGRYISPARFRARFAPTAQSVAAVERYLRAAGFRVRGVPKNHAFVAVEGTVAAAEAAFATKLEDFDVGGRVAFAPVRAPSTPPAIGQYVTHVEGLDTTAIAHPLASPPPASVNAPPCSGYFAQQTATGTPPAFGSVRPWVVCGYTPHQLQSAYGVSSTLRSGIDGRGQRVAIIDAYDSPTIQQDVNTYSRRHGLPSAQLTRHASAIATYTPEVAGPIDPQGWAGEETLDVEAVHSMAPRAAIVYEGADSAFNVSLTAALNDVVDNKLAQIVSNSYGSAGDFDNSGSYDTTLKQAAAEGIGVYFSSGDQGDETKDPNGPGDREVDSPANDPLVTAVGGTSLAVGSSGNYLFETGWGTSKSTLQGGVWSPSPPGDWMYGGGGGTSQTYAEPSYQVGVVPAAVARYWAGKPAEADAGDANGQIHVPGRAVPDVSMVGDPSTGFIEGLTEDFSNPATGLPTDDMRYGEYRIGGTSVSCPLFAGLMALADQAVGHPHGFANPALYAAARSGAFHDVSSPPAPLAEVRNDYTNGTSGPVTTTLRSFSQLNTLATAAGYDDVTGLGSPNGQSFLRALSRHR